MEKFINFKQLNVVKTAASTSDGSASLKLIDSAATFFQDTLINAIVWDRTTASATGGQMYIVTAVDSTTQLSLVAIGPTASQGTGVPNTVTYFIYMPENTISYGSVTDGLQAVGTFQLIDTTVNFVIKGVKVGDTARDITSDVNTTVLGITTTTNLNDTLTVSANTFLAGDDYVVYRAGAVQHDKLVRSADIAFVENNPASIAGVGNNSRVDLTYDSAIASASDIVYAYSDTGGGAAAPDETMRDGINDAIISSLETSWSDVAYDFPGTLNAYNSGTNATWLGGKAYFILRIQ